MKTTNQSLDHALHNEKVCKHLDRDPDFADWVITTAFYSALHFVRHKIFPLKRTTTDGHKFTIPDFDTCCKGHNPRKLDKHKFLSELVEENCSEICDDYDQLKDMCWTARYNNYKYNRDMSNKARKLLQAIKEHCYPEGCKGSEGSSKVS